MDLLLPTSPHKNSLKKVSWKHKICTKHESISQSIIVAVGEKTTATLSSNHMYFPVAYPVSSYPIHKK